MEPGSILIVSSTSLLANESHLLLGFLLSDNAQEVVETLSVFVVVLSPGCQFFRDRLWHLF